jgi:hypothetical protein
MCVRRYPRWRAHRQRVRPRCLSLPLARSPQRCAAHASDAGEGGRATSPCCGASGFARASRPRPQTQNSDQAALWPPPPRRMLGPQRPRACSRAASMLPAIIVPAPCACAAPLAALPRAYQHSAPGTIDAPARQAGRVRGLGAQERGAPRARHQALQGLWLHLLRRVCARGRPPPRLFAVSPLGCATCARATANAPLLAAPLFAGTPNFTFSSCADHSHGIRGGRELWATRKLRDERVVLPHLGTLEPQRLCVRCATKISPDG